MRGKVKNVSPDRGFGFIIGEDKKDYFFHLSAVQNTEFKDLKKDDPVTFNPSQGPRGLRAESVHVEAS